jgi:hypothetical protein
MRHVGWDHDHVAFDERASPPWISVPRCRPGAVTLPPTIVPPVTNAGASSVDRVGLFVVDLDQPGASRCAIKIDRPPRRHSVLALKSGRADEGHLELSAATETTAESAQCCRSDHAFHLRSHPSARFCLDLIRAPGHRAVARSVPETIQQSRRMHTVERSECALP